MAKMPQARLCVALPKGTELRGARGGDRTLEFVHGDHDTKLAMDITDALRAMGYKCKLYITKEVAEEY